MTTAVDTSSSGYLRGLFGSAQHVYDYAKQVSPALLTVQLERLEGRFQPITARIKAMGEPLIDSLDARLVGLKEVPRALQARVSNSRLYAAVLKSWLAYGLDYERFITAVKRVYGEGWQPALAEKAKALHAFLQGYVHIDDVLLLAAALATEGNERLMRALVTVWEHVPALNMREFVDRLKTAMGKEWKADFTSAGRLFYSLASLKAAIAGSATALKSQTTTLVRKAKDVANRTSFLLLRATDQAVDASIVVLDEQWVSRVCSAPGPSVPLRGFDRLAEMEHRLHSELSLFIATKQGALHDSRSYQYVSDKVNSLKAICIRVRATDVYALTWPQKVKSGLDRVFLYVGLESLVRAFDHTVWEKLDADEDREVSVGDLVRTVGRVRQVQLTEVMRRLVKAYRATYGRWVKVGAVNGEHQD